LLIKRILTAVVILLFLGTCIIPSNAINNNRPISKGKTFYVGGTGPGNYTKIQEAVDNASDGDRVFVYNDSSPYYEDVIISGKSIIIIGEDKKSTIVKGSFTIGSINIISNLSINNSHKIWGIKLSSNNKINSCIFYTGGNNSASFHQIYINGNNNEISKCIFKDDSTGCVIYGRRNNLISNNTFRNLYYIAIDLFGSNCYNNTIIDNYITKCHYGVHGIGCNDNFINNNTMINNYFGTIIEAGDSSYNNIICNNGFINNKCGLRILSDNNNNLVFHNNFVNNYIQASDRGNNVWDNGYPSGGNYWSDYNGTDSDGDGIGDAPYPISDGNNEDRYPLGNFKPSAPEIDGTKKCKPKIDYDYTFVSTDPDGDDIWYHICWGDKEIIHIYGPYPSGEEITLTYNWADKGTYIITCWARDTYDAISEISKLEITVPRTKTSSNYWYHWLIERFPLLERLLSFLL
jgi:hypothetical protein